MGVVETEEAFRAELSEVCIFYYHQVWNEALDQAGVEASFALRRAENVYYPQTIRASGSKVDSVSNEADEGKESPTKALPTTNISSEAAEHAKDAEKAVDLTKEVAPNAPCLQTPPKSPPRKKRLPKTWRSCLQLSPYPLRKTSRVKDLHLSRRPPPSLPRPRKTSL